MHRSTMTALARAMVLRVGPEPMEKDSTEKIRESIVQEMNRSGHQRDARWLLLGALRKAPNVWAVELRVSERVFMYSIRRY